MKFLVGIILSVIVIAFAFHNAKPLPNTNFEESFLPKASSVKYIAAGNDATVAGLFWIKGLTELGESFLTGKEYAYLGHVANLSTELDSLFFTPYYFVSGLAAIDSKDTTDFFVFRRAVKTFPENWQIAVSYALRLAKGPYKNKIAAADVMRPYFNSPDTTLPIHVRTMYRSFELDAEQIETALEMALNDVINPRFKQFRAGFYNKIFRVLGYKGFIATNDETKYVFEQIKKNVDEFVEQKISPQQAYFQLLSLKRKESVEQDSILVQTN